MHKKIKCKILNVNLLFFTKKYFHRLRYISLPSIRYLSVLAAVLCELISETGRKNWQELEALMLEGPNAGKHLPRSEQGRIT
jgi:hypothetical protein